MKFSEAKDRLKELANGRHYTLEYVFAEYSSGKLETRCRLYMAGAGYKSGPTWEDAFAALEQKIDGPPIEEYPDIEPKQAVGR